MIATIRIEADIDNLIYAVRAAKYIAGRPDLQIWFRHGAILEFGEGTEAVRLYAWRNKRSIGVRQVKP